MPVIFGIGSGRCGTHSLAELINLQPQAICFHEMNPSSMRWAGAESNVHALVNQFLVLIEHGQLTLQTDLSAPDRSKPLSNLETPIHFAGDVALYYLPYIEGILKIDQNARFPCLRRNKEETVKSFVKKLRTGEQSYLNRTKLFLKRRSSLRNPWAAKENPKWQKDPIWDHLFPTIEVNSENLEDYVSEWYDFYYSEVDKLSSRYKENVKVFDMARLNSEVGQREILNFCGFPEPVFSTVHVDESPATL